MGRIKDMLLDSLNGTDSIISNGYNELADAQLNGLWPLAVRSDGATAKCPLISEYDAEDMVKAGVLVENKDMRYGAPRFVPSWKEADFA